jgi:hypothetical protein
MLFVLRLVSGVVDGEWPWHDVLLTVGFAMGSAAYFASAIALLKSDSWREVRPPAD